jgi:hypothetical protein
MTAMNDIWKLAVSTASGAASTTMSPASARLRMVMAGRSRTTARHMTASMM